MEAPARRARGVLAACLGVVFLVFFFEYLVTGVEGAPREAYVTFVASDEYAVGARTLGASLRATGTKKELVAVVLRKVSQDMRARMRSDGWRLIAIPLFPNPFDMDHYTFTKLSLWSLVDYHRIVFLDADCIVRTNIDEVFQCGEVLCAGLGRHESRKFDFDFGLLVLHPSKPLFQQMLSTAEQIARTRPETEFNFMNTLFMHWCQHGTHPDSAPGPDDLRYEPPLWEPTSKVKGRCFQLDERYNWQWGSDSNDTLLGTEEGGSEYQPSVRVVHFAGKNVKPWVWKNYPLHGWITLWHSYASQVSGLVPVSWYAPHLGLPLAVLLVVFAVSASRVLETRYSKRMIASAGGRPWTLCLPPVFSKHLSIWLFGAVPLLGIPAALYRSDVLLPTALPPLIGWSLFFAWTAMLYWAVYGPYVLYHYMLGCAFASPAGAVSSQLTKRKMGAQLEWLRSTPCFIPRQTSVITACLLHSLGFTVLGNILILVLASFFAWSSPLSHLTFACAYSAVVFLLFFALWGAGLPRHAFLTGFRLIAPPDGQSSLTASLARAEAGAASSKND